MKRNRIVLGAIASILTVACVSSLLYEGTENVQAATRLYGVQQVVEKISEEDPLVILEMVPDNAMASFGAYVYGKEPMISPIFLANTEEQGARRERVLELLSGLVTEESNNGTGTSYPMYYNFNTLYQEQLFAPSSEETGWQVLEYEAVDGVYHTEERVGYYQKVGKGEGNYVAVLVSPAPETSPSPSAAPTDAPAETPTAAPTEAPTAAPTPTAAVEQASEIGESSSSSATQGTLEEATAAPTTIEEPTAVPEATAEPTAEPTAVPEATAVPEVVPVAEGTEPTATPEVTEPTPTPEVTEPTPTPEVTEPTPTPEVTEPTPTPEATEPTPTPEPTATPEPTPEPVYEYYYAPGNAEADYIWVDDDTDGNKTYTVAFEKLYYKVNLTSNNWLAKNVLEYNVSTGTNGNIEVITVTPSQLEDNISRGYLAAYGDKKVQGWNDVDLLYISNSSALNLTQAQKALFDTYEKKNADGKYINDISAQTGLNIYQYIINTGLPVIMDSSIVEEVVGKDGFGPKSSLDTNLQKLAFLLWDYTSDTTPDTYNSINISTWVEAWPTGLTEVLITNTYGDGVLKEGADSYTMVKPFGANGSVQGSVYICADASIVSTVFNTKLCEVAFDDLAKTSEYVGAEACLTGLSEAIKEINTENFYNEINGVDYTTEYNTQTKKIEMSRSSVVKYIFNFAYRRAVIYKDTITVLDIEPTRYSTLTETTIRSWLNKVDSDRIQKINIVQMTTAEFIGTISDLNAEYDMIYIGSCIGPAENTGAMNQDTNGDTVYNDTTMNKLIYTHVGDIYGAPRKFKGQLDSEYVKDSAGNFTQHTTGHLVTRFSGNDITKEKMDELKAFVNSGYPVVISDKFYVTDTTTKVKSIDTTYIDNSSYLYEFMNHYTTVNPKANVMSDSMTSGSANFATYLNMSKLYLSMIQTPVEYSVKTNTTSGQIESAQFLPKTNGKYILEYVFEFSDNSEARVDSIAYEVKVYIDTNADGRYDSTEEMDGLTVVNEETDTVVASNRLVTGVRYSVTRELPEGYVGMIPWKLEITQNSTSTSTSGNSAKAVHTSAQGYTAVPTENDMVIKVYQIKSGKSGGIDLSTNQTFKNLFANVKGKMHYDIQVTSINASAYVDKYKEFVSQPGRADNQAGYEAFYEDEFAGYDMLVLGFVDMFDDIDSHGATMAMKMFIESGRSVLFSHDTTSFVSTEWETYQHTSDHYWAYHLNRNIRSIVGMDRYGVTEDALNILRAGNDLNLAAVDANTPNAYVTAAETLNKDIAYKHKTNKGTSTYEVHGYSNIDLIMWDELEDSYLEDVYYTEVETATDNSFDYYNTVEGRTRVKAISQVNKGQITSFPFNINLDDSYAANVETFGDYTRVNPVTMAVAETHSQYYQLDLGLDKTNDQKSDIVVWYCLADSVYDGVPNDVRNNYYIYSAGNIMYTGMGHNSSITTEEAQLFVNTMIASFDAGKRDPSIAIVKDANSKGVIKKTSYRTYDPEIGIIDTDNETIYFHVNDSNIFRGTRNFNLKYYVEILGCTVENCQHTSISYDGQKVCLRELTDAELAQYVSVVENQNDFVTSVSVKPGLFISQMAPTANESTRVDSVRIFISAQTTLIYDSARPNDTTGTVYTSITIKARDLFDLD